MFSDNYKLGNKRLNVGKNDQNLLNLDVTIYRGMHEIEKWQKNISNLYPKCSFTATTVYICNCSEVKLLKNITHYTANIVLIT